MKKNIFLAAAAFSMTLLCACASNAADNTVSDTTAEASVQTEAVSAETEAPASETDSQTEQTQPAESAEVASGDETVADQLVIPENMEPVYASSLKDGVYSVTVNSSSSMFNITDCELTVADGKLTAVMTMGGKGYSYIYGGTGDEAAAADSSLYISPVENDDGAHTFTMEIDGLDMAVDCAAFSTKKEKWYERTLLFRADSLPTEAFADGVITKPADLGLADGMYNIDVTLEGGSGRASVESPALLTVEGGDAYAVIVWSSSNYDYMRVNDEKILNENEGGNSTFTIPVEGFDFKMAVSADTTAMSTPHEIDYTLFFDSASITPWES